MKLALRRVIIFTRSIDELTAFYRDVLGLPLLVDDKGWKELDAGGARLAIHAGTPSGEEGAGAHKLAFFTDRVAETRAELVSRGVKMKATKSFNGLDLCDGEDPDGNVFQLSNRV